MGVQKCPHLVILAVFVDMLGAKPANPARMPL